MQTPSIPEAVQWRNGLVLDPSHFLSTDRRHAVMSHLAGLLADPWPWGFVSVRIDETALASFRLRVDCEGIFPDGTPFRAKRLSHSMTEANDGDETRFCVSRHPDDDRVVLQASDDAPGNSSLPVARLVFHGGVWSALQGWSAPALLIDDDHPMRVDLNRQIGSLAAVGAGFMATLRMPGVEDRPGARVLGQVAATLAQGVGILEALLAGPAVTPGRLGLEALRLALGVRSAAGVFERVDEAWDPADQRGSLRRLLYAAESAASGIGLPFRASLFQAKDGLLVVAGMPTDSLVLAIEASRPADLIAARAWFDGAALAAPERIQEALTRRVAGCPRRPIERDPRIGVSSGPLLALYNVNADPSWRGAGSELALAAKTPVPPNTSFSVLLPEGIDSGSGSSPAWARLR